MLIPQSNISSPLQQLLQIIMPFIRSGCLLSLMYQGLTDAAIRVPSALQAEVAEKEKEARSTKKLQEIAGTAREEAAARVTKATQEYERAFARANPGAAVMVGVSVVFVRPVSNCSWRVAGMHPIQVLYHLQRFAGMRFGMLQSFAQA